MGLCTREMKGNLLILWLDGTLCDCLFLESFLARLKLHVLAPAVTVGETEGAMDSTSVFFGLFFCL